MSNIDVFYHVYKQEGYQPLVKEQLDRVVSSGLYEAADNIFIYSVGGPPFDRGLLADLPKIKLVADLGANPFEFETLNSIKDYSENNANRNILYMHTKGITTPGNRNTIHWRKFMEFVNIDNWKECVDMLKTYDAVGGNLVFIGEGKDADLCFAGNIWWARSNHLRNLPIITRESRFIGGLRRPPRLNAEFWVAAFGGHFGCLMYTHAPHDSAQASINNYVEPYPEELYKNTPISEHRAWADAAWGRLLATNTKSKHCTIYKHTHAPAFGARDSTAYPPS